MKSFAVALLVVFFSSISLAHIGHYNKFDKKNMMSDKELDEWIKTKRHKVMFKDASRID